MKLEFLKYQSMQASDIKIFILYKEPINEYTGAILSYPNNNFNHTALIREFLKTHPSIKLLTKCKKDDNIYIYAIELSRLGHILFSSHYDGSFITMPEVISPCQTETAYSLYPFVKNIQDMCSERVNSKGEHLAMPPIDCGKDWCQYMDTQTEIEKTSKRI